MKFFNTEDVIQVLLGSIILATPIAFTQEAWRMSQSLPILNVILIFITSILLNACIIYYGIYEADITNKRLRFIARIFINYTITLIAVSYILFLLNKLPPLANMQLWISRVILISFPASLSGAILDSFDKE